MSKETFDLNGRWQFKEYPTSARQMADLDTDDWLTTSVPSSIYTSLIEAGKINRFDLNSNPENFTWPGEKPWIYKKTFDCPEEILDSDRIDLLFEGLDTIATIWLNDKLIGRSNNMFIPHRFNVTTLIKQKENSLLVKFDSPVEYAKKLMKRYTKFREEDFLNPYRVYIRKAQFQFGWDFCPHLPGCGIHREVKLEAVKKAQIKNLNITTIDIAHDYADIKINLQLDKISNQPYTCQIKLTCQDQTIEQNLSFESAEDFHSALIRIEAPHLWWPAGYGRQNLYRFEAKLSSEDQLIDLYQTHFGIRTVKLIRTDEKHKPAFQFEINNQPIFAKGANWIHPSIFAGSVKQNDYEKLLEVASDSNFNMLRVWGGGVYESDHFYKLCDELGIMVWQDFMFACAYYPDYKWFSDEIKKEAATVIKKLRNHPSLILWCGNNEIDWMHAKGMLGKSKKFHGKQIFHKLLPRLTGELSPNIPYVPTTPLAADKDFNDQNLTIHQWGLWTGFQPLRNFTDPQKPIPYFVTEFGSQSLPDTKTIQDFCPQQKMHVASRSIEKHNYHLDGNSRIARYIADLFGSPKDLDDLIYISQLTKARRLGVFRGGHRFWNFYWS